jgi:hypothetical protein
MSSVDVIVPCYRYGQFLRECVVSVLTQSIQDVRVLIINDASPDNTAEIAAELRKKDSRISYIEHPRNRGHIYTYNEGIDWVSADYLLLLSADDYLLPGALSRAVTLMEKHPRIGFTFGNSFIADEQGVRKLTNSLACEKDERILTGQEFITLSGPRNIVPTPSAVVRTELQKRLGGYRTELPHSGDMELWLRLAAHSSVGFIGAPQAVYRRHAGNMSLSYAAQCYLPDVEQRRAALDAFFETCSHVLPNPTRLQNTMHYSLALDAVSLASAAFNDGDLKLAEQISAFAVRTFPKVKRSWFWRKLAFKRTMGLRAWQALRPAADRVRRLVYAATTL